MPQPHAQAIHIFTDGACKGNPGRGGWGALLRYNGEERELFGGEASTTNNRMELTAVIEALAALKRRSHVVLHTDSQYVQKGITEWITAWVRNGWKTSARKPVKNVDLWSALREHTLRRDVTWKWVMGHSGDVWNERCHSLVEEAVKRGE